MTLKDQIIAQIRATGPLSVAEYMNTCLLHPSLGYYTSRAPFGKAGDFVTAPEISQMFGELVGLSIAQSWIDQGRPAPFTLAELGPGRGTLMADALRATRAVPGFAAAADIHLLEASPALREVQRDSITGCKLTWIEKIDDLPDQPLFVIANEFFDALPLRQFVRDAEAWRERQIGLQGDTLSFGLGPASPQPALDLRFADTGDGGMVEDRAAAIPIMASIARRIDGRGGAALVIDYGDWHSLGDTLQAVQAHRKVDALANPGAADLTAHVDFAPLAAACAPCIPSRLTPQGVFLERLGITARAQALARSQEGAALDNHVAAHRRLTHPDEMGTLFKVLGLVPTWAPMLPGLEK